MRQRAASVNSLLIFLIYGMFALFALFLVVIGAQVYRGVVSTGESNAALRTGFCYISNKLRMNGDADSVSLEERGGVQVLTLKREISGEEYETRIYYDNGVLWEQFTPAGAAFDPSAGEKITAMPEFSMTETSPGELYLSATAPDGVSQTMHLRYLIQGGEP